MIVTATELLMAGSRRGRLLVRPDGLFQFATETYNEPDEECGGYWMNDYPPSGIYSRRDDAVAGLQAKLKSKADLVPTEPLAIELDVGPWDEPILRQS
ncbi:hypothetical protein ACLBKU_15455 [Erythrobacter sp. NE805]|uniref:hypothetical protein n=1 Tax=Erythrobacter sp. NE805 TaxID=3389875 RepID=UPI00396B45B8